MALKEIDKNGTSYELKDLGRAQDDFDRIWYLISAPERQAIEHEINRRLEELLASPNPQWGSITNTSIEGGKVNPITGIRGDWRGTPFQAIYDVHGENAEMAGMFYGNVWKNVIIGRDELWIGIRNDPTFPERGITLQGKSYFPDQR